MPIRARFDPRTVALKEDLPAMKGTAGSSGSLFVKSPVRAGFDMSSSNLFICTTCLSLTSLGKGMQRCDCEGYKAYPGVDCPSGYHLCYICAGSVAGGTTRWSWNVCHSCLAESRRLTAKYGMNFALGRHSIMNSIAIPINAEKEIQEQATEKMIKFFKESKSQSVWGILQARTLFESVNKWQKRKSISTKVWEAEFSQSETMMVARSVKAFKDYLRIDQVDDL